MRTGAHTRTGVVVPKLGSIKSTVSLTKEAKLRLKWIDYYLEHGQNARLTCRHFGIAHRTFYRYYDRFKKQGPRGLESRSHRPERVRQPTTPPQVINAIKVLRKLNPEFSKYKLQPLLKQEYGYQVSVSTIGRVISRYQLFFTPPVKPKGHPGRRKHLGVRKPYGLKASCPGELIEVDVKHMPGLGNKRYGFCAIDPVTKQATIHVASSISSNQAAIAWKKTVERLGLPQAVLTDNGSENMGAFAELVDNQQITHYWARPHTPKDKPHIERFIGSLERECIQWGGYTSDLEEQQLLVNSWLKKYHSYRPHQALGYLTPDAYKAKLQSKEVAPM